MTAGDYRWVDVANIAINNTPWTRRADGGLVISLEDVAEMNEVASWMASVVGAYNATRGVRLTTTSISKSDAQRVVDRVDMARAKESDWLHSGVSSFGDHSRLQHFATPEIYASSTGARLSAARALIGRGSQSFSAMSPIGNQLALSVKTELAANARLVALTASGIPPDSNPLLHFASPFADGNSMTHASGNFGNCGLISINPYKISVQQAGFQDTSSGYIALAGESDWYNYFGSNDPQTSYYQPPTLVANMDTYSTLYDAQRYPYGVALGIVYRMEHGWCGYGAPTRSVDTTYVFWGATASSTGVGRDQTWSVTGPTMAQLVAATGWSLRPPVSTASAKYGDVISAYPDQIGLFADWQNSFSRWISDFYQ